jgi:hypothetical protein
MSRGPATFRQSDAVRLMRAAIRAGLQVARVEADRDGNITLVTSQDAPEPATGKNEWDSVG